MTFNASQYRVRPYESVDTLADRAHSASVALFRLVHELIERYGEDMSEDEYDLFTAQTEEHRIKIYDALMEIKRR